jgi:phage tail sheath gpL-like
MAISDAVLDSQISRVVGYKLTTGNFQTVTPNLPQRIALLGEANEANQTDLDTDAFEITSSQQAGQRYGYGSPLHIASRILLPQNGGGVSGIPVIVYPQAVAGGATSKIIEIAPSGTATDNGTHTLIIAGRNGLDGEFYDINILAGDGPAEINDKISDAVNNILGAPFISTNDDYTTNLTSKWKGLTANDLTVTIDTNDTDLGIDYAISNIQSGAGTPSIAAALTSFGNDWNTIVINTYGTVSNIMTALEQFNGRPDPTNPTGRFVGIIMKPFIAITGSTIDDPSSITDTRLNDLTIAIAPAPLSAGLPMEAAANMGVLFALVSQNTPHLDVAGKAYPDMPTPTSIGSMADYANRNSFLKKGCSTVDLVGGQYVVQDFVTTYHKLGENPPQFRYCRNIMVDLNVRFGYYLLEQINVVDHAISADNDTVSVSNIIKPKQWIQILNSYANDLGQRALIVDVPFMQNSIRVGLSTTNPDRLESFFRYKRSGFTRVNSTTAEAGFNFGTLN